MSTQWHDLNGPARPIWSGISISAFLLVKKKHGHLKSSCKLLVSPKVVSTMFHSRGKEASCNSEDDWIEDLRMTGTTTCPGLNSPWLSDSLFGSLLCPALFFTAAGAGAGTEEVCSWWWSTISEYTFFTYSEYLSVLLESLCTLHVVFGRQRWQEVDKVQLKSHHDKWLAYVN